MTVCLVVEKSTGRVAFARDFAEPSLVDGLYSPVEYEYMLWTPQLPLTWTWDTCWHNRVSAGELWYDPPADLIVATKLANLYRRATVLQRLAICIERHRAFVCKPILGQQQIYDTKREQAQSVVSVPPDAWIDPDRYPYVRDYAELHSIGLRDAASMILFRHGQQQQVLLETEQKRMSFTKRILECSVSDLPQIQAEIDQYASRA